MKKSINLKSNTLCVCVLILVLLCLLLYRNGRENFVPVVQMTTPEKGAFGTDGVVAETVDWSESEAIAAEELRRQEECNAKRTEYQTQINNLKNSIKNYVDIDESRRQHCDMHLPSMQHWTDCMSTKLAGQMNRARRKLCSEKKTVKENYNYLQNTCGAQHYNDLLTSEEQSKMESITCH